MNLLTLTEENYIKSLSFDDQLRFNSCVHESGHAIMALLLGVKFSYVVATDSTAEVELELEDLPTIRTYTHVLLGGWAACELFFGSEIDFMNSHGFSEDLKLIDAYRTTQKLESLIGYLQPNTKVVLSMKMDALKAMTFALFSRQALTYNECYKICALH